MQVAFTIPLLMENYPDYWRKLTCLYPSHCPHNTWGYPWLSSGDDQTSQVIFLMWLKKKFKNKLYYIYYIQKSILKTFKNKIKQPKTDCN